MKPARTIAEARALASARNRQWQMREEARRAHEEALKEWRAPFVLTLARMRRLSQRAR